jgi:glutamine cyclotransferase
MKTSTVVMMLCLLVAFNAEGADDLRLIPVTPERVLEQFTIPVYRYKVVQTYPHDRTSFTEGLVIKNGTVYEGTGRYGHSKLLKWDLHSGRIVNDVDLSPIYFGEGITILHSMVYQLTYLENTGFVYDANTFQHLGSFRYTGQGWGLTNNGKQLLMSDGSSSIQFLNPMSRKVEGRVLVTDDVGPVGSLNGLEFADGKLYANVWQTDFIAVIRPDIGKITGWIDLTGLNPDANVVGYPHILNGIAHDEETGHLLVTGKFWPSVFELELTARAQ